MSTTTTDRTRRIEAIRDAALVRIALGQAAIYRRVDDGQHEVAIHGQTTVGATLQEAIRATQEQRP